MPRRSLWLPLGALFACLVILAGCKKKRVDTDSDDAPPAPAPGAVPAAVSTDAFVFAHVDVKSIRTGALFGEIKQTAEKAGEWDKFEDETLQNAGIKPTSIDAVTAFVFDVPNRGPSKSLVIVTANQAFNKAPMLREAANKMPDARGFYEVQKGELLHFPDDKTLVYVHADLAQKYLDGYAKNRSGWPLSADTTRAAAGHTAFVVVNMDKLPADARRAPDAKQLGALLTAKKVVVTADLKGKELSATVRGTFPDAATAGTAKDMVTGYVGIASAFIAQAAGGKGTPETAAFLPAITEGQRALKAAKVEVSGPDVVVTASYKADFDVGRIVADLVKQGRENGPKALAQNHLKQIGLALHSYHDANQRLLVHGTGANGTAIRNLTEKPLLSWRVAILPYIEQDNLYKQFKQNEPWDGPNNKKLIDKMPQIFAPVGKNPVRNGYTHLQMVVGPNAMQPMGALLNITDGTSNTLAVVEAAEPVIWTKPDDVMLLAKLAPGELKKKFGGLFPGGFYAVMWDGTVRFVKDTVSERTLGLALNPADGQPLGADW
ncbi:DUF1559 family PulG-like putative transporter [Frigoriglobus tundricola]|uniref:DUF1559 domain-containing protein n=1 Tax=Frigoriglobus tundricola TaxID=2774151 RepID=A0A6M5YUH1_9BACT|nr:DUF1559 domain-containing protein [Frigoriglobus tundricola]QJW97064.1 hypothetical protein FTUN_4628 [Frigoriglobus tundricola]